MMNKDRAIINGKIATIKDGQRIVTKYQSGEKLVGEIKEEAYFPYTGYVRGFGKRKRTNV